MEALEEAHLTVQQGLYDLSAENLRKVCEGLEVSGVEGKTKRQLIRLILDHLDSEKVSTTEDEGMTVLLTLQDVIADLKDPEDTKKKEDTLKQENEKKLEELFKAHQQQIAELEEELKIKMGDLGKMAEKKEAPTQVLTYRKDLRINGQVGSNQQKDRLTYGSLTHQIDAALRKGYKEEEIVEAVIRATNPGIPLRSVLEGDKDLKLPQLKAILRSHYQEKGATELFQELSELSQGKAETPQEFVMRAMDLKRKILKSSNEAAAGPQYNHQQVQALFINAITTGLGNETIRADIKPFLVDTTSDEVLLERLTVAVSLETKRQQKVATKKKVTIQAVSTSATDDKIAKLTEGLDKLTAVVMALQESRTTRSPPPPLKEERRRPPTWERGCKRCREADKGQKCDHCFKCGESSHYARGCKAGNGPRSLPGGRK